MEKIDILLKIFDDIKAEYNDYLVIENILKKLDEVMVDYKKVDILDEYLNLLDENSQKIVTYLKLISRTNTNLEIDEFRESINYIKKQFLEKLNKDVFYYEGLWEQISHFKDLKSVILSNKTDLVLEFIWLCYKEGKISIEDAVELNFCVAQSSIKKDIEEEEEEVKLEENEYPIYDELEKIFQKYGYNYNSFNSRIREKFNKYAKLDYVDYILSKLSEYKVTRDDLVEKQKEILRIIIDRDNNTFDSICALIDNNDCTMSKLLGMGSIFHRKKRKYVRNKTVTVNPPIGGGDDKDDDLKIVGAYDNFINNLNLLKKYDENIVMDDQFFWKKKKFLLTPTKKILDNLEILRRYGICDKDSFPTDSSCLTGKYTAYQLDRFIEVGYYDYIKNNPSYVNRTKSPFKFYKIRRGTDIGDIITLKSGKMLKKYTDYNIDLNGISYKDAENVDKKHEIIQEYLTDEQIESIPYYLRRDFRFNYSTKEEYYEKLNVDSYTFHEFTPVKIFPKGSTLGLLVDSKLKYDNYDFNNYDDSILEDEYIKMLDSSYCRTIEDSGNVTYNIKKNDYVYEFRPFKYPNSIICISRQKVLILCSELKNSGLWINDDFSLDDKINLLLSILVKDTILSNWELYYLRSILVTIVPNFEKRRNKK